LTTNQKNPLGSYSQLQGIPVDLGSVWIELLSGKVYAIRICLCQMDRGAAVNS
jgi:hypothetical protein